MINFEDLKSQWEKQPEQKSPENGSKLIIEKMAFIKRKQQILNVILIITSMVLIFFFFYIAAYNTTVVAMALLLMIGSVLGRICIEYFSIKKLKKINVTSATSIYKQELKDYHKKRIKIHYRFTPIIIILYATGFVILLPFFKKALSSGFFTYIQISSIVLLIILSLIIVKQARKELNILKELQS